LHLSTIRVADAPGVLKSDKTGTEIGSAQGGGKEIAEPAIRDGDFVLRDFFPAIDNSVYSTVAVRISLQHRSCDKMPNKK
jgi:hypothetical protein